MWDQVTFEDQRIPSNEALYRHYRRSSWVIDYWCKASDNMQLLPVTSFGWKLDRNAVCTKVTGSPYIISENRILYYVYGGSRDKPLSCMSGKWSTKGTAYTIEAETVFSEWQSCLM